MKKIISIILFVTVNSLYWYSCISSTAQTISDNYVENMFPEGIYEMEVLDSLQSTDEQKELTLNFMMAYQDKMEEFNNYFELVKNKQKAKFPKNEYITEKEMIKLREFSENVVLLPSTTEKLEVKNVDGILKFKATGKLSFLDYISYDIKQDEFLFDKYTLSRSKNSNITDSNNALQEPWVGGNWKFREPEDVEVNTKESLDQLSAKNYKVTVGKLVNSGRKIMLLKAQEVSDGVSILNLDLAIREKN